MFFVGGYEFSLLVVDLLQGVQVVKSNKESEDRIQYSFKIG